MAPGTELGDIWLRSAAFGYIAPVPSDEELMAAYIAGDRAAFRELFQRYAPLLERAMARDLRSTEEANDLVQQTFLHLHRSRLDFEPGRKLKPWIFTITLNLKREFFRRSKRRQKAATGRKVCSVRSPKRISRKSLRLTAKNCNSESTPKRSRTSNLRFRRPMLYPVELWVPVQGNATPPRPGRQLRGLECDPANSPE